MSDKDRRLKRALRGASLQLAREGSQKLARQLRDFRIDIAILRRDELMAPLEHVSVMEYPYRLFVPYSLAGSDSRWRTWLPRVPMILPAEGWMRTRLNEALAKSQLSLRVEVEGGTATLALRGLREGHYAAILPAIAGAELKGAKVKALDPDFLKGLKRKLVAAWHPRRAEMRGVISRAVRSIQELTDSMDAGTSPLVGKRIPARRAG